MSDSPRLYLLSPPSGPYLDQLDGLFEEGVDWFQYRRQEVPDPQALEELARVVDLADHHGVTVIVNDRPDLALAADAGGVHLGARDLPPDAVKSRWPHLTVGATQRAGEPLVAGADYYGVGPVYGTSSKRLEVEPCGWNGVREVLGRTERPVFAIGGLRADRLEDMPEELQGVCVLSAIWGDPDPPAALARLQRALAAAA